MRPSGRLDHDGALGAVPLGEPRPVGQLRGQRRLEEHAMAALVLAEEVWSQGVAAAVADAELEIDPELHPAGQTRGR